MPSGLGESAAAVGEEASGPQSSEEHEHMMFGRELSDLAEAVPMPYQLRGRDVPDFYLVMGFFHLGNSRLQRGVMPWRELLSRLGVEDHSPAEEALRQGMLLGALTTTKRLSLASYRGDPEARRAAHLEFQRQQREELAAAFYELRRAFATSRGAEGVSLERFVRDEIAQGTSVGGTEPMSAELIALDLEFTEAAFAPIEEVGR